MNKQEKGRAQSLFLAALEQPVEKREAWLAKQCGPNPELLNEVLSLISHDGVADDPLEAGLNLDQVDATLDHLARDKNLAQQEAKRSQGEADTCSPSPQLDDTSPTASYTPAPKSLENYRILESIGVGGMGQVFKAEHKLMKRIIAIKFLTQQLFGSSEAVDRFHREVQAAAKLSHPNIVQSFDAGSAEGSHYLVMEYVEGENLHELVLRGGPLEVDRAVDYVRQTANGLAYAHDNGIVHRDIKPANLLVDASGNLKILDLGLARLDIPGLEETPELTQKGTVMGTPEFMAPEQSRNPSNADVRADIYSLGCTLYYLLTGSPPYPGENLMDRVTAHHTEPIPSLLQASGADESLDQVFQTMVAKSPDARFQSMNDLLHKLEEWTGSDESPAPSTVSKPNLMFAVASVSLVLVAIAVVVLNWGKFSATPDAADKVSGKANQKNPDSTGFLPDTQLLNRPRPLRKSTGRLYDSGQVLGDDESYGVALGDIDLDGDLDAVVANRSNVQAWMNQGDGSFIRGQQIPASYAGDVQLADLDGDDDLDAVVSGVEMQVLMNDGEGRFQTNVKQPDTIDHCTSIALSDLDDDGDVDAVSSSDGTNRVYLNNGRGVLANSGQSLGQSNSIDLCIGDLDQDGDPDVVFANWESADQIWLNNGKGVFELMQTNFEGTASNGVHVTDIDQDDDLDILVAVSGSPDLVYLNEKQAGFTVTSLTRGYNNGTGVTSADLDGDQRDEIVITNNGPNLIVRWNQSVGWFAESLWVGNDMTSDIALGDLDGDGDLDAFAANKRQPNRVAFNQNIDEQLPIQDLHFRDSGQELGTGGSYEVALGDLDGDSDIDAIVANSHEPDQIWLNDGTGNFRKSELHRFDNERSYGVRLADLDSDGDLDAFIVTWEASQVWFNDGQGRFKKNDKTLGSTGGYHVCLGDVDGDKDLDAVVAYYRAADHLWLNDGTGHFVESEQVFPVVGTWAAEFGDLDQDGDQDLLFTGTMDEAPSSVWLNNGQGRFTDSGQRLPIGGEIALGDIDGDHDLDALVIGESYWLNDGKGLFSTDGPTFHFDVPTATALVDLDGDQDLDVWISYGHYPEISGPSPVPNGVWLNESGGKLRHVAWLGFSASACTAFGDLDGDGDLDAFVANRKQPNKVWINETPR